MSSSSLDRRADRRASIGRSAVAHIYELLYEEVISGGLEPGQALSEKELADRYQVSRTPVREAVIRLAREGLLQVVPQLGTFVSRISVYEVTEMQFARETLERASLRQVPLPLRASDVAVLHLHLATQQEARAHEDQRQWFVADEAFHRSLLEIAGHTRVWDIVGSAKGHLDRVRRLSLPQPHVLDSRYAEHESVVDALIAGDVAAADRVLTIHLRHVLETLSELEKQSPHYIRDDRSGVEDSGLDARATPAPRRIAGS